ncbi:MAG: hypothetical protein AB7W37_09370, partial [Syntrophobacteraceae bacterium]
TGYNLREGGALVLAGALGGLDMSGLSDDGSVSIKPEDGKTASLTGFVSNGGAAIPMSSGESVGFLQSVLRFPHH